jgi:hypothetical protein
MMEKYFASSCGVGAWRRKLCAAVAFWAGARAVSARDSSETVVEMRGVES